MKEIIIYGVAIGLQLFAFYVLADLIKKAQNSTRNK